MSDEARGATRSRLPAEPGWEALLDPAVLEARLVEARARREAAIARRKAAHADSPPLPSSSQPEARQTEARQTEACQPEARQPEARQPEARAERMRSIDRALAGGEAVAAPLPHLADPVASRFPASPRSPAPEAVAPLHAREAGPPASPPVAPQDRMPAGPRPLPAAATRTATPVAPSGPSMPERLAAVIVPPRPTDKNADVAGDTATPDEAAPPRRGWVWGALGLGLGAGAALALAWWQAASLDLPDGLPTAHVPAAVAPPTVTATRAPIPARTPAPVAVTAAPAMPAEVAGQPALATVPAGRDGRELPAGMTVARLGPAPGRLPSIEAASAAVAGLAAETGRLGPMLRFADGGAPDTAARTPLVLPGGSGTPVVALAEPAEPAPTPVRTRSRPTGTPAVAAAEPTAPPAAEPAPAETPGMRGRLERAVETMLRNRILGQ
ncbi:MAG: hypothetical protein QM699_03695 [Amaricoccus sp.]|uniref:hypothetical protein n=1 Tax=Amaricoccus sp. TaxID=1872485 RepID=UPI0039E4797A